jgi:hypothetical protein
MCLWEERSVVGSRSGFAWARVVGKVLVTGGQERRPAMGCSLFESPRLTTLCSLKQRDFNIMI